jgi:predicted Zn-dependent peptidase
MINQTLQRTIIPGVNLHMVQSDKFKTVLFGIYIKRPLVESEVALNALLSRVIDKATANLHSSREMSQALEMLYGTLIVSDVHKYGEKQMIQIKIQVPGEQHVGETGLYRGVLAIINDMINHPKVAGDGFDPEMVEREKEGLVSEITLRKDHKDSWVMSCCIENMCKDEHYHIHELGTVESVKAITPEGLLKHLRKIWNESEIDVCVIGDYDADLMENAIIESLEFSSGERTLLEREKVVFFPETVNYFEEAHDLTQGKLCMGYRINVPYESPLYAAALVASVILGGGGSSKFFKRIREKEGLCYSIYSRMEKYKSIMLVYAGVDFDKFSKTESLVEAIVEDVKNGRFTDEELEIAKKTVVSNIQSVSDYPNSYINFYYNLIVSEGIVDEKAHIRKIEGVTRTQIIEALSDIRLDTVARLVKEDHHG